MKHLICLDTTKPEDNTVPPFNDWEMIESEAKTPSELAREWMARQVGIGAVPADRVVKVLVIWTVRVPGQLSGSLMHCFDAILHSDRKAASTPMRHDAEHHFLTPA